MAQSSGSDKQSEKHLIFTLKIAFRVAFPSNVSLKSCLKKKKIADFVVCLSLHLFGTEDSQKQAEISKATGVRLSLSPGTQGSQMPLGRLGEVFTGTRNEKCTDLLQKARGGEAWKMFPVADKQLIITLLPGEG